MIKIRFQDDTTPIPGVGDSLRLYMQENHKSNNTVNTVNNGIICATDFSESSKDALRWSVSLATQLKCHLTILFTYRLLNIHNGEIIELKKTIEKNAIENFTRLEKEFLIGKGIAYDFKVEVGFISNRVKDYAKKNAISLLVMSNSEKSMNRESIDELVETIQIPLLIVPK